jgi:DNA primase
MGRISQDKIQEIKDRTDIVELVSSYLPLKRSGSNHLGLCPFHQEKTPSFNVNSARQIFHCFGCGVGGNVFTFLMRIEGLNFPEAVKQLGEKVGIEVEEEETSPAEAQRRSLKEKLAQINHRACEYYHHLLLKDPQGNIGRRYLRQRGYQGEIVRRFELGFAPDSWDALVKYLPGKGYSLEEIKQSGLVRPGKQDRGDYDLFRKRLLFPIYDLQGRVAAFGGRVLDEKLPKYLNSPETALYQKGKILYGMYQARDAIRLANKVIVVEGYFDVLALSRAGFENSVATCGTALTVDHARLLKRYAEKVLLIFDQDDAGRQATFRAMEALLPSGLAVSVIPMPLGEDPDSLLKQQGEEGFKEILERSRPVMEYFIEYQIAIHDDSVEGKARAVQQILPKIQLLPDEVEKALYTQQLSKSIGIDLETIKIQSVQRPPQSAIVKPHRQKTPARQTISANEQAQKYLLRLMILDKKLRDLVRNEGTTELFFDSPFRLLADHLLAIEEPSGKMPVDLKDTDLDESMQSLLSHLIMQDEEECDGQPQQIFDDCRQAVLKIRFRRRLEEIGQLMSEARQKGDEEAEMGYLKEFTEINQKLKKVFKP